MVAPPAVYPINDESLLIGADQARDIGKQYATKYQSALPYPHICIDDFLPDAVLKHVLSDLKARPEAEDSFNRAQEFKKTSYPPERLPDYSKTCFTPSTRGPSFYFWSR